MLKMSQLDYYILIWICEDVQHTKKYCTLIVYRRGTAIQCSWQTEQLTMHICEEEPSHTVALTSRDNIHIFSHAAGKSMLNRSGKKMLFQSHTYPKYSIVY